LGDAGRAVGIAELCPGSVRGWSRSGDIRQSGALPAEERRRRAPGDGDRRRLRRPERAPARAGRTRPARRLYHARASRARLRVRASRLGMGITIAQALQIGALQRGQILAGHAGLRRTIEHVSVLEIPLPTDSRHYRDQELYIANLFGVADDQ